jgi:very-short-patch-repair endonuclease
MNKQRNIMPVRKLFRTIPNLLLTLKPCLMMSPLSVSLFLEGETYKFDTVIFDEASQVCTENAIGAIFRGKQVIIAGDSKQLPPTNFFTASTSDVEYDIDDDEVDDTNAYESILDEANLLPERTLLWHYRSRHEHLIAFSNTKIYRNNLITFPSNIDKIADNGVEYIFVKDGFYDRGGKRGNVPEAKKIAELVFEHFRKQPNRSLGVIAFGEVQQQAIDAEIRSMRIRNQEYEHFFNEEKNEPFFIKNLENVQGDERDTIIFSIGYAKDAAGVFRMNFGPLNKSGGERRLNVAITRAKFNIKLVGSIMPTDIDIDRISSDGPKLLRGYIDFAINGTDALIKIATPSDFVQHDSPFEEAVYNFLDRKGYKLDTQVGCSEYRIDMAVKHPTLSGIYILGVECDGATYHSARTARERDRLRQDVLENRGWKIYRIWSTDWIKDSITEGEKLINAIENAIYSYSIPDQPQEDVNTVPDNFVTVNNRTTDLTQEINPYQFEKYKETSFSNLPRNSWGYIELTDCITLAVNNECPLHYELLCQKVAYLYGNEKATIKIRREVDYALQKLGNKIYRKDDFLFPSKDAQIVVRMPNTRKINHISVEEIAEAMTKILAHCFGTNKEGLCSETRKIYGFGSSGANIAEKMNTAFDLLVEQGRVKIVDGKIALQN